MQAAIRNAKTGNNVLMPPPDAMPQVRNWLIFNGYKGFFEFDMRLRRAPAIWYDPETYNKSAPKPVPKSLYQTVRKYNKERAEEYKKFYEHSYGKTKDHEIIEAPQEYEGESS
jgi:hypothetical protein